MAEKDLSELKKIRDTMKAAVNLRKYRKLDFYKAYPKQQEFHNLGATKRERLLMAGNQQGKTYCGGAEAAFHLTGEYPADWKGRRYDHPTTGWVCGESGVLVRDKPQAILCGKPGVVDDIGTGLIPKVSLKDWSLARGVTDAYDTIQVVHKTNGVEDGISTATFKSYEQGRTKFQSESLDWWWADEEPPPDIYQELIARLTATGGMGFVTFTPLKGRTEVVIRYTDEPSPDRAVVNMTIEDAEHIKAEDRQKIIDGYDAHEREARARGIPLLGSGVIFTMSEAAVVEAAIQNVPLYWAKIWGIDFGIGHPFGAALLLWDKDNDIIHVHHAFKMHDGLPMNHARGMKNIGIDVPVSWPQDGTSRDKGSGVALQLLYKKEDLKMLHEHATWPEGGNSTEAGVKEMQEREANGKLKYASHLSDLLDERRFYHRKDGQIVKIKDDILSAVRVGIMMKRFAKPVMLGSKKPQRLPGTVAKGLDFDLF
jgi:phage terminase large subunit-like protein